MARETITQRIELEGADEIKKQLQDIGTAGEEAFQKLNNAGSGGVGAGLSNVTSSVDRIKSSFQSLGPVLDTLRSRFQATFSAMGASFARAPQQAQEIQTALTGVAGSAAATVARVGVVAAGAIAAMATTGSKAGVEIAKGAEALKTTTADFQELRRIADASGMGDGLSKHFQTMAESAKKAADAANEAGSAMSGGFVREGNMWTTPAASSFRSLGEQAEFARGNIETMSATIVRGGVPTQAIQNIKTYEEALKALGIRQTEFRDGMERARPLSQIYADAAAILSRLPPSIERTRIAQLALGEEAGRWLRLIEQGPAAVDAAVARLRNNGRSLGKDQIADAQDFAAAMAGLRDAATSTAHQIGLVFAPSFTKLANDLADAIDRNRAAMVSWATGELKLATEVFGLLVDAIDRFIKLDVVGAIDKIKAAFTRLWAESDGSKGSGVWTLLVAGALAFAGIIATVVIPAVRGIIFLLARIPGMLLWTVRASPFILILAYLKEIMTFFGRLKAAWDALWQGDFSGAFGNLKTAFGDLFKGLSEAGAGTWVLIGLSAARVFGLIYRNWSTLSTVFGVVRTVGSAVWSVIASAATGAAGLAARAWAAMGGGAGLWAGLATAARVAFTGIVVAGRVLVSFLAGLVGWPAALVAAFATLVYLIGWDNIVAGGKAAWESIKSGFSSAWDSIKAGASSLGSGIAGAFSSAWEGIKSAGAAVWDFIASAATTAWEGIKSGASGIGSALSSAWDTLKSGASAAWDFIKQVFSGDFSFLKSIGDFFVKMWDGVKAAAETAWNAITSFIVSSAEKAVAGVKKLWEGLKDFVSQLFGGTAQAAEPKQQEASKPKVEADTAAARAEGEKAGSAFSEGLQAKTAAIGPQITQGIQNAAQGLKGAIDPATQAIDELAQKTGSLGNGLGDWALRGSQGVEQLKAKTQEAARGFEELSGKAGMAAGRFEEVSGKIGGAASGFSEVGRSSETAGKGFEELSGKAQQAKESVGQAFQTPPGVITITRATGEVTKILDDITTKGRTTGQALQESFQTPAGVVTITRAAGEVVQVLDQAAQKAQQTGQTLQSAIQPPAGLQAITTATGDVARGFEEVSGKVQQTQQVLSGALAAPMDGVTPAIAQVSSSLTQLQTVAQGIGPAVAQSFQVITQGAQQVGASVAQIGPQITTALQSVSGTLSTAIDWTQLTMGIANIDLATPMMTKFQEVASSLAGMDWSALTSGIIAAFNGVGPAVSAAFSEAQAAISAAMASATASVQSACASMISSLQAVAAAAREAAAAIAAANAAESSSSSSSQGFARGGYVSGPGTGTSDSILARLSDGEFVMKARAVRKYGLNLMAAINSGRFKVPKFNTGGLVSAMQSGLSSMTPSFSMPGVPDASGNGSSGRPLTLVLDGQSYTGLTAQEETARALEKLSTKATLRSAGRKPTWFG